MKNTRNIDVPSHVGVGPWGGPTPKHSIEKRDDGSDRHRPTLSGPSREALFRSTADGWYDGDDSNRRSREPVELCFRGFR